MKIENWSVVNVTLSPYSAPETGQPSLQGMVFGHPRFVDVTHITTSMIVGKNQENEILTKSGSAYVLGEIDPNYEKQFPDAKNRLLGSLTAKE